MSTFLAAPYPGPKVTVVLPSAEFEDTRAAEQEVLIQRSMSGNKTFTYVKSSDRFTLRLTVLVTRPKSLEVEAFARIYHPADWLLTLHDGTQWVGKLTGAPLRRTAVDRLDAGNELIELTLEFSGYKL